MRNHAKPWDRKANGGQKALASQEIGGYLWPRGEDRTAQIIFREAQLIPRFLEFVKGDKVCVQAGGNVGVYPNDLAHHFDKVYTFEPDPFIYSLLERNIRAINVVYDHAALGETIKTCDIVRAENCGASYINFDGDIPVVTIDSLNLDACDFIWLDIEGYEFHALQGGLKTIEKFKPTIAFEDKGLQDRYGVALNQVQGMLKPYGYVQVGRIKRDTILCA